MITILDGPLGTELGARGVSLSETSWSAGAVVDASEVISAIHREYADCGATVHTANTFRTKQRSVGDHWATMATTAVQLCKQSVPDGHRVAGSIAPLEDCYQPALSPGEASRAEHRELAEVLAAAGADILLCETFAHVGEAIVAVEESVRTSVVTWVAFTAGPNADLMLPSDMAEGARQAVDAGAAAVLINCTPASQTLEFVAALADAKLNVPIGAYANSGESTWLQSDQPAVDRYLAEATDWIAAGATLVGGCCGVRPAQIAALAQKTGV